jgi:2'-5' RNA ligase
MRLFIALHLEPATLGPVQALQEQLRGADAHRQVRWVEPGGMHLTLKFLGETPEDRLPELRMAITKALAGRQAPRLALAEVGGFPNLRRARVFWVGLREAGQALLPLQGAIEGAMEGLGWEREGRLFQPHLTLGRRKEAPGRNPEPLAPALERALTTAAPGSTEPRAQSYVALMCSHLGPGGARYESIATWELPAG